MDGLIDCHRAAAEFQAAPSSCSYISTMAAAAPSSSDLAGAAQYYHISIGYAETQITIKYILINALLIY